MANPIDRKFFGDLIWNYVSLGVMGVAGVLINFVIAYQAGPAGLGVFNQIYAVFVIVGQVAVGGVHHSALKHVAETESDLPAQRAAVAGAIVLAAILGTVVAILLLLASGSIGAVLASPATAMGIRWACPGIALFALNKVLLGVFNGQRRMRLFAIFQSERFLLMIACTLVLTAVEAPIHTFGAIFSVSEGILLVSMIAFVAAGVLPHADDRPDTFVRDVCRWIGVHFRFGVKGMGSGLLIEANVRIDVLMLGLFASDSVVGVYSFASTLGEGFYGLLMVVRNNVNPLLVPMVAERRISDFRRLVGRTWKMMYPLAAIAAAIAIGVFPMFVATFYPGQGFEAAIGVLAILLGGLVVYAGVLPFDFILLQAGRPGGQSLFMALTVATNVVLNLLLIPVLGMYGAATATACAYLAAIMYLNLMTRKSLGFTVCPK